MRAERSPPGRYDDVFFTAGPLHILLCRVEESPGPAAPEGACAYYFRNQI